MMRLFLLYLTVAFSTGFLFAQNEGATRPVFENGTDGYACYRIPALVKNPDGRLLAFCEARKVDCDDFGKVDIVMKESRNGGMSWSPLQIVAENGTLKAGNPAPVWDLLDPRYPQGRLFLFYNTANASEWDVRSGRGVTEVWYRTSTNNGRSWSEPVNITTQVHHPNQPDFRKEYHSDLDWRTNALGPGHAIQLLSKNHRGRLFIPANHSAGAPLDSFADYRAYGFYSDDHGATFQISQEIDIPGSNESIATEGLDGTLVLNTRQQSGVHHERLISMSHDGGTSWDTSYYDAYLPDPVCQGSTLLFTNKQVKAVLFSNPQSIRGRQNLVLKASLDGGSHWTESRTVWPGDAAYSDLTQVDKNTIGILFEKGNKGSIHYSKVTWQWLLDGKNEAIREWIKPDRVAGEDVIHLARPQVIPADNFFRNRLFMEIKTGLPGTRFYFTEDGSEPDERSNRYYQSLEVKESKSLKIKAFHDQFAPSATVTRQYFSIRELPALTKVKLESPPSAKYLGEGAQTLQDHQFGNEKFDDGSWLGFEGTDCSLLFSFNRPVILNQLIVSNLVASGSWIMAPSSIEVYTSSDGIRFDYWDEAEPELAGENGHQITTIALTGRRERFLKVVIKNLGTLPPDHPGAGQPAWLFVDEVVVE